MATLKLQKRKDGSVYVIDFRSQGIRHRVSTKTSDRRTAELFLKDIEVQIAKGKFGFGDVRRKEVTLQEFMDRFLQFSKAMKAAKTFALDQYCFQSFSRFVGNVTMNHISNGKIEDYRIKRLEDVKPATVNLEIRHLKSAFELAVRWGVISANPFKGIKQVKVKNSNLPMFFGKDEVAALLDSIPDGDFKNLIQFYLYTGCRREEALHLTWKDIDLERRKVIFRETKSGLSRVVPLNGAVVGLLKAMERAGERPFPFNGDFVTHRFKKYLRASGVDPSGSLRLHSLRHTFASHLVMAGVDITTVSRLLGHSSVKVTEIYAHLAPDHLKSSVERLQY